MSNHALLILLYCTKPPTVYPSIRRDCYRFCTLANPLVALPSPILPLNPQYRLETSCYKNNFVSLLAIDVSAYFRDTLRWQTTRFIFSVFFNLTAKAESHLINKRGFLTLHRYFGHILCVQLPLH